MNYIYIDIDITHNFLERKNKKYQLLSTKKNLKNNAAINFQI